MGYEWSPITSGNANNAMYGVRDIGNASGVMDGTNTWGMVWYDDPAPPATSGDSWGPSQYSYQVQVPYTYYEEQEVTTEYPGRHVSQTVVMPRAGWVTSVGLYFTQLAAEGDVRLLVCRSTGGKPDPTKVIGQINIPRAALKKYPERTKVTLPPFMVAAGERVGFDLITQGTHYAALGDAGYTEGTLFLDTDGAYLQGDITKDLKVEVYMAKFKAPRTEILLQNISLAGGITDLAIKTEQPTLDGATLIYEMQIAGIWQPISKDNLGKLTGLPEIVPLRAVSTGTSDIQAGIMLGAGRVEAWRSALASPIASKAIPVSAKRYFQVDVQVNRWEPAKNTAVATLLSGAGYATVTASSTSTVLDEGTKRGWKRLRFTFDTGAPVNSVKFKAVLSRTADGKAVRRFERTLVATG